MCRGVVVWPATDGQELVMAASAALIHVVHDMLILQTSARCQFNVALKAGQPHWTRSSQCAAPKPCAAHSGLGPARSGLGAADGRGRAATCDARGRTQDVPNHVSETKPVFLSDSGHLTSWVCGRPRRAPPGRRDAPTPAPTATLRHDYRGVNFSHIHKCDPM